ncbi:MAG: M20/M25/M40 family metallo-hydrolase [Candidatus Rifleibacteriota bacterium]
MSPLKSSINQVVGQKFPECISLLEKLIACQSFSRHEEECARVLCNWLHEHGVPAIIDERGSVLAVSVPPGAAFRRFNGQKQHDKSWFKELFACCRQHQTRIIAFNAHMDVVEAQTPESWQSPPFKATLREGRIYGRGTCDMKGALAAMAMAISLIPQIREETQQSLIAGCFCTEEEAGEGLAFKELCEEFDLRPDWVLLGEPSQMQIARGQRGKVEFFIETTGKCAHTSVPEVGDNAAYKIARALRAIENLDEHERQTHGLAPENMLKRNTLVATSVQSWPESRSFVPDRARIHVTARTALHTDLAELSRRLQSMPEWPDARIEAITYRQPSYTGKASDWPSDHPAWETPVDHEFFHTLSSICRDFFEKEIASKIWPFSTDGVYSAGIAGIPTLGLGPGIESCAHIIDEWVCENQLKDALKIYLAMAFRPIA